MFNMSLVDNILCSTSENIDEWSSYLKIQFNQVYIEFKILTV
jgi:hypothetical protein